MIVLNNWGGMAGRAELAGFSDLKIAGIVSKEDVLTQVLKEGVGDMSRQKKLGAKDVTVSYPSKCPFCPSVTPSSYILVVVNTSMIGLSCILYLWNNCLKNVLNTSLKISIYGCPRTVINWMPPSPCTLHYRV